MPEEESRVPLAEIVTATLLAGGAVAVSIGLDNPPFEYIFSDRFIEGYRDSRVSNPTIVKPLEFLWGAGITAAFELAAMTVYSGIAIGIENISFRYRNRE